MPDALTRDDLLEPVAKHMRTEFVQLRASQTVGEALDSILSQQPEGRIIYFYIADDAGRLVGVVPTRRLLLTARDKPLAEIMVNRVVSIPHSASVLDACEFFVLHKLLAFPIVDDEKRMIGLVDVDLYTKELGDLERRDDSENLFQLIGVHLSEAQQASPIASFRKRFPWLITNIVAGILAAILGGFYEPELQHAVALALFIPVVLALAESVCIQSVSLALQSLHAHRPTWAALLAKLASESITGITLGSACGIVVGLTALVWIQQFSIAFCILTGIAAGVTVAACLGLAIPNLLRLMRRDPQVAAGPVALALTDMITLLIYFNLARWLIAVSH